MIADRSGFLSAARSSRWNKEPQVPVDLSDADPHEFSDYLQLVYTGTIVPTDPKILQYYRDGSPAENKKSTRLASESYFHMLTRLYVFADKLEDLMSANMIMDCILDFNNESNFFPALHTITWVWEHTPANSPLRRLVRDIYVYETLEDYFDDKEDLKPPYELLMEMIKEHRKLTKKNHGQEVQNVYPGLILAKFSKCRYHQHKDGELQCK
jgi:hypothetical protein